MILPNVAVVSSDARVQKILAAHLARAGMTPVVASTMAESEAILDSASVLAVVCYDESPGCHADDLIRRAARRPGGVPVIVVSRHDDWEHCLRALHAGAFDYVAYPPPRGEIERVVRNATVREPARFAAGAA